MMLQDKIVEKGVAVSIDGENIKLAGISKLSRQDAVSIIKYAKQYKTEILKELSTCQYDSVKQANDKLKNSEVPEKEFCFACGTSRWWRKKDGSGKWVCPVCHPPPFDESIIEYFSTQDKG